MEQGISRAAHGELAELRERAQRAIEEARVLIVDNKFLRAWARMRPSAGVRRSPSLDD